MWQYSLFIGIVGISAVTALPMAAELMDGSLVITAYQQLRTLYIDGIQQPLINATISNQPDRVELTETNRLIAVSVAGDRTCGGLLASIGDAYVLTNGTWRCYEYTDKDWEKPGYDDSWWPNAVEFGSNADGHTGCSQPQFIQDISADAKWIWVSDQTEVEIYCRGYIPICDSSPCQNNGTCQLNNKTMCRCTPQFTGTYCETEILTTIETTETPEQTTSHPQSTEVITTDTMQTTKVITLPQTTQAVCYSSPCQNNGTCLQNNVEICRCLPQFTGTYCETELNKTGLVITAFQSLGEVYIDGQTVVLPNANNWSLTDRIALPPMSRLISFKGLVAIDSPCAGVLASVNDTYLVTNNLWKCSPYGYPDWTDLGYDDSSWPSAVEYGSNGNHMTCTEQIHFTDISSTAQWIWTNDLTAFAVYCRGYLPLCWTSSPCLNGGTCLPNEKKMCDCTPQFTGTYCESRLIDGTLAISAYQQLQTMYIDGIEQPLTNGNTWNQTDRTGLTDTNRLIAVTAAGDSNCGGLLASFGDAYVLTDNYYWKCNEYQYANWNKLGFDDSSWPPAVEFGSNADGHTSCSQLGTIPDISADAKWIWVADQSQVTIYCRGYIHVCDSSPCQNNGTCLYNNANICNCVPPFTGTYCETETFRPTTIETTNAPEQTTSHPQSTEVITTNTLQTTGVITLPQTTQGLLNGGLIVTAYQQLQTLYIDGLEQSLTNGNMWSQPDSAGLTETSRLIAVTVSGDSYCGGLLASFGDAYVLTGGDWKCNSYQYVDWNKLGFDDSSWPFAVEFGSNANGHTSCCHLRAIPDIHPDAKWIWVSDQKEQTIYCRGYLPVCDSSPCQNSGTCLQNDVEICRCLPQFTGTYCETELMDGALVITAYQKLLTLYIDGIEQPLINGNMWNQTHSAGLTETNRLIAVMARGDRTCSGLLASIGDGYVLTDGNWKCYEYTDKDWERLGYDESWWPYAVEFGSNADGHTGCSQPQFIPDISADAKWIWVSDQTEYEIYCRGYIPVCENSPCQNSGTCLQNDVEICRCLPQFTGTYCETVLDSTSGEVN